MLTICEAPTITRVPSGIPVPDASLEPASALIRLTRITGEGAQAALARQALGKINRHWQTLAEVYLVYGRDQGPRGLPSLHGSRVIAADAFLPLLRRHRTAGHLFVPGSHGALPDLALYALASGVPPEALCLAPEPAVAPLHGTLFLRTLRPRD